ncbi:MAG: synthetase [Firmicutes bacterium]|nr:synthetase [Bacillota bacterium]
MIRIALGQIEIVPGRPDVNSAFMLKMIEQARQQGADIIIFPELAIPGYLLGDTWEQQGFLRECEECGRQVISASIDICVVFGNVGVDWQRHGDDGRVRKYNALFTAYQGKLWGNDNFPYPFRIKTLHPNYREFDDTRHFYSLRKLALETGRTVENLLQPVQVDYKDTKLTLGGILCEDGWNEYYPVNPVATLSTKNKLDVIINISCSPFTLGKNDKRNRVFSKQAAAAGIPLVYVNAVGLQNNGKTVYTFDGFSSVYDGQGQVIATCSTFQQELKVVEIPPQSHPLATSAESDKDDTIENVYQALTYGIRKFMVQTGLKKVVIGVSGGIDSAVNTALFANAIGSENLLLVNMPSIYNSSTTKGLSEQLAANLGCSYTIFPIQEAVDLTIKQITSTPVTQLQTGTQSTLKVSSFVAENIQARDRSARVLAGLAAAFGGAFTCNANKSELTVGYSTLYGDQAGFIAALGDLWKHQVYALGQYLNTKVFSTPVIPQGIFDIIPSAELSFDQAVEEGKGDPLYYPYHDYLFQAFIEWWNRATPEDILTWYAAGELEERLGCEQGLTIKLFATPAEFITDLEKWWKLYTGLGVAKRIQAPPILAVSRRAYGFDHREAQNQPYFTRAYNILKTRLLEKI